MTARPRVAVIGGGIAGLAAALDLAERADVTVFEAKDRLGGPMQTVDFAGTRIDTGPDSFLARRPEMIDLATRLGLGHTLVAPAVGEAAVWSRGALRKMPAGMVLGVPRSMKSLAASGIVSRAGVARAALDKVLPRSKVGADIGVGDLVRRRLGHEVQERLVDPLLGGIHAGRSELLSAAVAAPQLLGAARGARSLMESLPTLPPSSDPVFLTVPSGLGDVVGAALAALDAAGTTIATNTPIGELRFAAGGCDVVSVSGDAIAFDGVVLATPSPVTARLLTRLAPDAASALSTVTYASVVLTLFAYKSDALREPFRLSGFLVPRPEKKLLSAISWSSAKWAHHRGEGTELVRASTGRIDDRRHEDIDDADLVARLHDEIVAAIGLRAPAPIEARVNRWPNALPQFKVDHLTKVAGRSHAAAAQAAFPLALAGSAYEGLGLPACVASGRAAAARVLDALKA
ncbi:MAG: protoporphyrinogen oxidase [Actinobacteria bacterium]|nr:protoporphyrinogen oxidase [Actinomycetota bacterium]